MSTTKLYLPYGTFGSGRDREVGWYRPHMEITIHWFVMGRQAPLAPYEALILGYRNLSDAVRTRAERTVDEFFSESEFHLLRDYLRTVHDKDLRTAVLCAPVAATRVDVHTRAGAMRPFAPDFAPAVQTADDEVPIEGAVATVNDADSEIDRDFEPLEQSPAEVGYCRLTEEPGYSLPFAVWGYFAAVPPHNAVTGPSVDFTPSRSFARSLPTPVRSASRPYR